MEPASDPRTGPPRPHAAPFRQELTPVSFLERAGTVHANRVAVIVGDARYTWAAVRARARRLASALRSRGLRRGDRVAFLALNSEPLLTAHFAVPMAGGVIVAINTRLSAGEVGYIVTHSGSRFLFLSPELSPLADSVPEGVERCLLDDEFEQLLSTGDDASVASWLVAEEDLCAIDYTSGTTGRPKGVMYHHRGAYLNALGMVIEEGLTATSNYLWTLPMFHCNGWSHTWAVAAAGSTSTCVEKIDPPRVWELLAEGAITHFNAAPTVLIMLANDPAARRLRQRVRVCTGGAPPSPTLIAQMERLNIELVHLYGLTETYGPLTINVPPPDLPADTETVARYKARQGFPHVSAGIVQVVDDEMQPVPADGRTLGEVVARGNTLMTGYLDDPEETARTFAGGWLHTGDVGVVHPDGSVELRDRKKDIIISGGENISTIEVEQAVMSHPAVLEAAVIAVPDERWGEVPKAFVTLKPDAAATADQIIEHVRGRIAHFKAPKHVWFGELPRTSTGKIQKYVLREREWAGRESRIH
jgi:fatty-acyl-CoA synthase